ncbi:methyltransferase domain-containing protein [Shewanella sp. UCD-KL12]|uniref:methyltransferase domain-containing protein n=1 Tax=Shewanella sp. UCD-KL12 TaxID=1917163 RepID=UPI000970A2C5|nr:methyltransferase domain-containing protein [Shewanella sp. UCD-KL12]
MEPKEVVNGVAQSVNDNRVAEGFSAAAKNYHQHDRLQKMSAACLFEAMQPTGTLLDIGAGPGTDFSQFEHINQVISLDLALGMVEQVKLSFPQYQAICANAEKLPLADNSIDSAYSNLALQWCSDLSASFTDTARVMKPNGEYHLSIVAKDSLAELDTLGFRVNGFRSKDEILTHVDTAKWHIKAARVQEITVYFPNLKALLYSIKGVGASINANQVSTDKIRGRGDWQKIMARAEKLRCEQGIPLTYQVAQLCLMRISD